MYNCQNRTLDIVETFLSSCEAGHLEKVSACLTLGVDVNAVSEDGKCSGLSLAAASNQLDLLDLLLSQPGVDLNLTTAIRQPEFQEQHGRWTALQV